MPRRTKKFFAYTFASLSHIVSFIKSVEYINVKTIYCSCQGRSLMINVNCFVCISEDICDDHPPISSGSCKTDSVQPLHSQKWSILGPPKMLAHYMIYNILSLIYCMINSNSRNTLRGESSGREKNYWCVICDRNIPITFHFSALLYMSLSPRWLWDLIHRGSKKQHEIICQVYVAWWITWQDKCTGYSISMFYSCNPSNVVV